IRLLCSLVADAAIEGAQERASRAVEPEPEIASDEPTYDDVEATDELVAALAGGAALSFAPDDDEDLLPGLPPVAEPAPEEAATPEEIAAELAREAAEAAAASGADVEEPTPTAAAAAATAEPATSESSTESTAKA